MPNLSINPEKETQKIVDFLRSSLQKTPFKKVIVGLSGGVDSATVTFLAIKALGKENVHIVQLPHGEMAKGGLTKSQSLVDYLNIPKDIVHKIDIKPFIDQISGTDKAIDQIRLGNIMARIRMIFLFDLAKKYKALVCGTENRTEHLLGYFTRFGDEASDIEPIRHLYKTQVKQLAMYLNTPQEIIDAVPSAGLWPGQTDEGEFGFSYKDADQILSLHFDQKLKKEEIIEKGFKPDLVDKVLKRVGDNRFKHELPFQLD
ncbi:hypothetical protein A2773_05420 [Candidatus Gottesmanbacteria bacterium RIFCSPHIGHO2_01_FULL_39_10]|uniref:NH(3)-dependent NAD(+) synthetase n=1 Tax=Candidatus Gottesmanbacteria bacterium RIFCSPHIGHO2_01_FULL_39_10 TaxID=1798375 RepID=A0A1F5ZPS7_9BACT|nr:MAG: hypothetical protein A2773_05420 [Candidatus Gottesmanbacteria bacterium RIFCSPHIGHO2_01_FULL_39_10]